MEVIQSIRNQFATIGIGDYDQTSRTYPLNERNAMVFLLFVLNIIINGVFFLHGADNFEDYVNSTFTCSTIIVAGTAFAIIVWKMTKISTFFNNLGMIVANSECVD